MILPTAFSEWCCLLQPETHPHNAQQGTDTYGVLFPVFSYSFSSGIYSMKSPGWQFNTVQILSITSTGRCFAEPVQIAEIVGCLTPVFSDNCICVISFIASNTFSRNLIIHPPSFYRSLYQNASIQSIRIS